MAHFTAEDVFCGALSNWRKRPERFLLDDAFLRAFDTSAKDWLLDEPYNRAFHELREHLVPLLWQEVQSTGFSGKSARLTRAEVDDMAITAIAPNGSRSPVDLESLSFRFIVLVAFENGVWETDQLAPERPDISPGRVNCQVKCL